MRKHKLQGSHFLLTTLASRFYCNTFGPRVSNFRQLSTKLKRAALAWVSHALTMTLYAWRYITLLKGGWEALFISKIQKVQAFP
jgi:hypothetical protein